MSKLTLQTPTREAFGRWFLKDILDWVSDNLEIDHVWSPSAIFTFVARHNEIWQDILLHIGSTEKPEDIFGETQLLAWYQEYTEENQ